jgi:hypothetical protein
MARSHSAASLVKFWLWECFGHCSHWSLGILSRWSPCPKSCGGAQRLELMHSRTQAGLKQDSCRTFTKVSLESESSSNVQLERPAFHWVRDPGSSSPICMEAGFSQVRLMCGNCVVLAPLSRSTLLGHTARNAALWTGDAESENFLKRYNLKV